MEQFIGVARQPCYENELIQQEPWQSWIGRHGGLKVIYEYLQGYSFTPNHRRILDVVLSTPEAVADVYADCLHISRATYFYQLRELITAIVQALNHWEQTETVASHEREEDETPLPRCYLPAPLTSLIGVEALLCSLDRLLSSPGVRLLTLLGPGGVGKTRLSVELARRQDKPSCFVDLSMLQDPSGVPTAIAQSLGIEDDAFPTLTGVLRDHEFLLILDNFEQILPARTLVTDLLMACPDLKIIVTSRAALHAYGEYEFVVPPLAIADLDTIKNQQPGAQSPSTALFVQRAQTVSPSFSLNSVNIEPVTGICRQLEGLPLAIELAAFQVKFFSPQAILVRLSNNRLNFLGEGVKWLPAHQHSMRAMLDWSFNLLSPELQMLFCRLSVFPGSFTIAEVETLHAVKDVQVGLITLVDHSLIRQEVGKDGEPCFRMFGMTREYARERCDSIGLVKE